jgi:hypothetical protein
MQNWGEKIFSNQQLGMRFYMRQVMIMVLYSTLPYKKNLLVNSKMFTRSNFHKYMYSCRNGNARFQIYHVLLGKRWHSSLLDV